MCVIGVLRFAVMRVVVWLLVCVVWCGGVVVCCCRHRVVTVSFVVVPCVLSVIVVRVVCSCRLFGVECCSLLSIVV